MRRALILAIVADLAGGGAAFCQAQDFAALAKASYDSGKLVEASDYLAEAPSKPPALAYRLGVAFYQGADRDCDRAYANLKTAADLHYRPALTALGDYYLNGCGPVRSTALAIVYYDLALKAGAIEARAGLGAAKRRQQEEAHQADLATAALNDPADQSRQANQTLSDMNAQGRRLGLAR